MTVISINKGTTTVYNKAGKTIAKHSSILPGGSRESKSGNLETQRDNI